MMSDFPLIKLLHNPPEAKKSLLPEGIKYQRYEIVPKEGTMTVYIPMRECEAFEEALMEYKVLLRSDVRSLLRTHRGIIEAIGE